MYKITWLDEAVDVTELNAFDKKALIKSDAPEKLKLLAILTGVDSKTKRYFTDYRKKWSEEVKQRLELWDGSEREDYPSTDTLVNYAYGESRSHRFLSAVYNRQIDEHFLEFQGKLWAIANIPLPDQKEEVVAPTGPHRKLKAREMSLDQKKEHMQKDIPLEEKYGVMLSGAKARIQLYEEEFKVEWWKEAQRRVNKLKKLGITDFSQVNLPPKPWHLAKYDKQPDKARKYMSAAYNTYLVQYEPNYHKFLWVIATIDEYEE